MVGVHCYSTQECPQPASVHGRGAHTPRSAEAAASRNSRRG